MFYVSVSVSVCISTFCYFFATSDMKSFDYQIG